MDPEINNDEQVIALRGAVVAAEVNLEKAKKELRARKDELCVENEGVARQLHCMFERKSIVEPPEWRDKKREKYLKLASYVRNHIAFPVYSNQLYGYLEEIEEAWKKIVKEHNR